MRDSENFKNYLADNVRIHNYLKKNFRELG